MVLPQAHKAELSDLSDAELLEMMQLTSRMQRVLQGTLRPHGFNLGINLGQVAGAGVLGHIHVHLVPRWNGDTNFMPVISHTRVIPVSLEALYRELKAAL